MPDILKSVFNVGQSIAATNDHFASERHESNEDRTHQIHASHSIIDGFKVKGINEEAGYCWSHQPKGVHPQGIHLRVGKDLAYIANNFAATATARNVTLSTPPVDLKSILQIMRLQARTGHVIQLTADGPDAKEAIDALRSVLECPAHPSQP